MQRTELEGGGQFTVAIPKESSYKTKTKTEEASLC